MTGRIVVDIAAQTAERLPLTAADEADIAAAQTEHAEQMAAAATLDAAVAAAVETTFASTAPDVVDAIKRRLGVT